MAETGITCPECGTENVEVDYRANYPGDNSFSHVEEDGTIIFYGRVDITWDFPEDDRLVCLNCYQTFPVPENIKFDYA